MSFHASELYWSLGVKNKNVELVEAFKLGSLSMSPFQRLLFRGSQIHFQKGQTTTLSLTSKVHQCKGTIRDLHKGQTEISLPRLPPKKIEKKRAPCHLTFIS